METFMKDLTDLNTAIQSTLIPADYDTVQKFMATQASMTTALNGLPAEYARSYLQVQTLKYDENNDPVDVTAEEALSIPESVISRYKQSWGNLKNTLEALRSRMQQSAITTVANVPAGHQVIEFSNGANVIEFSKSTAEFTSKQDLFSGSSEPENLFYRISNFASQASFADTAVSQTGGFVQTINLTPALMTSFTLDGNQARRMLCVTHISASVLSGGDSMQILLNIRGNTLKAIWAPPGTGAGSTAQNLASLHALLQNADQWTYVGDTLAVLTFNTYSAPSTTSTANLSTDSGSYSSAVAPGGLSTLTVDKVAVEIDLDDLDNALSSL